MIKTRKAKSSDSKIIYDWRNDELAREMSHTTNFVEWKEHIPWFASSLEKQNMFLLLCETENPVVKVAVVRFDIESTRALVSINLSPKMRGKGLSKPCLRAAIHHFSTEYPEVVALDAEIKLENSASQRAFESVGFLRVQDNTDILHYEYPLR
jgi:RimJ/RimL family protein N-acetyltransferase